MKKTLFIALAALAVLAGCKKDGFQPSENGFHQVNEDGTAYISLGLNLPTLPSTKANDVFDDGEGYEYTVENGTLVIFAGKNVAEDDLTLRSAYNLSHGQWNLDSTTDQITTTRTLTQQIMTANIADGETLYALVILNKHNFFNVAKAVVDGVATDITTLYQGSTELTGMSFENFKTILLDEADKDFSNQSFTMTNMPYAAQVGGANATTAVAPKILVEINSDAIYTTREDAETSAPAAEINVERLVAKVTVNIAPSVTSLQGKPEVALKTIGWFIDNTNPTTYVVRNVADPVGETPYTYLTYNVNNFYRMISASYVRTGLNQARTFWGIDANYNTTATNLISEAGKVVDNRLMDFDASHVNQGGRLRPAGSHYYCAENTFDVEHQTVKNTTRVIFAVEFNLNAEGKGQDFYTISTEQGTIRSKALMEQYVVDDILARVNVQNWLKTYLDSPSTATEEQLRGIFTATVTPTLAEGKSTGKATASIALAANGLDNLIADQTTRNNAVTAWGTIAADQANYIADNINKILNYYAGGVAYYQALIRHFDNDETPWVGKETMKNETESIYEGNDEAKYLGRYGVLRNNWYDITVTGIRQIGSSTVPELTDEPDDTVEQFISIRINIMPWAKRTQSVIL